jgi:hypothetical protein
LSKFLDVTFWGSNVILSKRHVVGCSLLHTVQREEISSSQTESAIGEDNSDSIT